MKSGRGGSIGRWLPLVAICGLLAGLQCLGEGGREWLRFDRFGLEDGQLWRLVTGHLVHLGWWHLALNLVGLGLMWALFAAQYSWRQWLLIVAVSMAAIDAGLYLFSPELQWYVGLSGVLHGVMAAGVVGYWRRGDPQAWLVTVFLVGKLGWEQWVGPLASSEAVAGGAVIVDAHLYGAVGAALGAACFRRLRN